MDSATPDHPPVERMITAAKRMYPDARIAVRRGRVIAITDDLIRLITFTTENPRTRRAR